MEYDEIKKTTFQKQYNIVKVLYKLKDIMEFLKTYKENKHHAVAFGTRKQPSTIAPIWFQEFEKRINKRIDNLVKLNNLKE